MIRHPLLRWLPAVLLLAAPLTAGAFFEDTIQHVAGPLNPGIGGAEFGTIFKVMIQSAIGVIDAVGVFMIVRAGLTLSLRQEDDASQKTKNTIRAVASGLIIINIAPRAAEAFLNYQSGGVDIIETEVLGLLSFFESLAAITAIIFIIISGLQAVASYGSEDGTTHIKRVVLAVGSGILLIALKEFVLDAVVIDRTPSQFLAAIIKIVEAILAFGAFVATLVIIYAGLLMILNIGKDEQYTRAKSIVIRVAIGLLVILTSLAIVHFVIG